jgi:hypothetical protein
LDDEPALRNAAPGGPRPPVSVVLHPRSLPSLLPLLPLLLLPLLLLLLLLPGSPAERFAVRDVTTCAIGGAPVDAAPVGAAPLRAPLTLGPLELPAALAPHIGLDLAPDAGTRRPRGGSESSGRRASLRATTRLTRVALTYPACAVESDQSRLNYPTTFGNPPPRLTS